MTNTKDSTQSIITPRFLRIKDQLSGKARYFGMDLEEVLADATFITGYYGTKLPALILNKPERQEYLDLLYADMRANFKCGDQILKTLDELKTKSATKSRTKSKTNELYDFAVCDAFFALYNTDIEPERLQRTMQSYRGNPGEQSFYYFLYLAANASPDTSGQLFRSTFDNFSLGIVPETFREFEGHKSKEKVCDLISHMAAYFFKKIGSKPQFMGKEEFSRFIDFIREHSDDPRLEATLDKVSGLAKREVERGGCQQIVYATGTNLIGKLANYLQSA